MKRMSAIKSLLNMAAFRSRTVLLVACQFGSAVSVAVVLVMTLLPPLLVLLPFAPVGRQNEVALRAPGEVMVGDDGALQGWVTCIFSTPPRPPPVGPFWLPGAVAPPVPAAAAPLFWWNGANTLNISTAMNTPEEHSARIVSFLFYPTCEGRSVFFARWTTRYKCSLFIVWCYCHTVIMALEHAHIWWRHVATVYAPVCSHVWSKTVCLWWRNCTSSGTKI